MTRMAMILEIQHETRLEYSEPVTESVAEVRMEPVSDADQSCRSFHLALSPATELHRYQDGFGNRVHHFDFLAAHDQVRVLAASVVETHPRNRDLTSSCATYPVAQDSLDLETLDFLGFRGPVRSTPRLTEVCKRLTPQPGVGVAALAHGVMDYIH